MSKITTILSVCTVSVLALAGSAILSSPAAAASYPVANYAQLFAAITDANANPGSDTITIDGTITLTGSLPWVTDDLTIAGSGSATAVIDGDLTHGMIRINGAKDAPLTVHLSGLTVTRSLDVDYAIESSYTALVVDDVIAAESFAGISVFGGSIAISNSAAVNNEAAGLALWLMDDSVSTVNGVELTGNAYGIRTSLEDTARLDVSDTISSNSRYRGFDVEAYDSSGATFTHVTAMGASDEGFALKSSDSATVSMIDTTATDNGSDGLEAHASGGSTITVTNSIIHNNQGSGIRITGEGGDSSASTVTITDTTVRSNGSTSVNGGGISIWDPQGMTISVTGNTVSDNTAETGGGIYAYFGQDSTLDLTIVNSTVSGNTGNVVGGVHLFTTDPSASHLAILSSTIVNNVAENAGPSGVALVGDVPIEVRNSIIADNLDGAAFALEHYGDLCILGASAPVIDHSLIQDPHSSITAAIAAGSGNLSGVDAKLGPLADNGGPTRTHLPADDSPAVDAGDPAFAGLTTDQRGQKRVVATIDLGAVELQSALAVTGTDAALPTAAAALMLGLGGLVLLRRKRHTAR